MKAQQEAMTTEDWVTEYAAQQKAREQDDHRWLLLRHYARKTPTRFYQFDNFLEDCQDDLITPGENGIATLAGHTVELMDSPFAVRVLVKHGTEQADIVRSLESVLEWVRRVHPFPPACTRCGGFDEHHPACEDKTMTDEQVAAVVAWDKRNLTDTPFPF